MEMRNMRIIRKINLINRFFRKRVINIYFREINIYKKIIRVNIYREKINFISRIFLVLYILEVLKENKGVSE